MAVVIVAGVLGGKYLDQYFSFEKPVFRLLLSLFGVVGSMYLAIKELQKLGNDNK